MMLNYLLSLYSAYVIVISCLLLTYCTSFGFQQNQPYYHREVDSTQASHHYHYHGDVNYTYNYVNHNIKRKQFGRPIQILMIGDSVDRFLIWDWCSRNSNTSTSSPSFKELMRDPVQWLSYPDHLHYTMKNEDLWELGYRCVDSLSGDSISNTHIYGANKTGPYNKGFDNTDESKYLDTEARINYILSTYVRSFGVPDKVFVHTTQWDMTLYYNNFMSLKEDNSSNLMIDEELFWHENMKSFEMNMYERVDQIQHFFRSIPSSCQVGLRTAVNNNGRYLTYYIDKANNITRHIARRRNLMLYDYNDDIWSIYGSPPLTATGNISYNIYRQQPHPRVRYSLSAVDKMLGHRYSNAVYDYHVDTTSSSSHMINIEHLLKYSTVFLIQTSKALYLIQRLSSSSSSYGRWQLDYDEHKDSLFHIFNLGFSDILFYEDDDAIKRLTTHQHHLPSSFDTSSSYMLADMKIVSDDEIDDDQTVHCIIFDGYFMTVHDQTIWDAWLNATSPSAMMLSQPLDTYWSQYQTSLFLKRGELDSMPIDHPGELYL